MSRGAHVIFKAEDEELWAVGWSDVHFKLYLATCGTSEPGLAATKERQRADGRNVSILIDRPSVVAEYANNMGSVDLHNRYRQGELRLHQVWKTSSWQTRMQNELLACCCVDAFLLARHYLPKWDVSTYSKNHHDPGLFFSWLGDLVSQILVKVKMSDHVARPGEEDAAALVCRQVPIGKVAIDPGTLQILFFGESLRIFESTVPCKKGC